jgi:hypothetical protein
VHEVVYLVWCWETLVFELEGVVEERLVIFEMVLLSGKELVHLGEVCGV